MTFQTTSRTTREDADMDWYVPTDEFKAYRQTNYIDNGKIESISRTNVSDTVRQVVITWKDEASAQEWYDDAVCASMRTARDTYETNNGISRVKPGTQ